MQSIGNTNLSQPYHLKALRAQVENQQDEMIYQMDTTDIQHRIMLEKDGHFKDKVIRYNENGMSIEHQHQLGSDISASDSSENSGERLNEDIQRIDAGDNQSMKLEDIESMLPQSDEDDADQDSVVSLDT